MAEPRRCRSGKGRRRAGGAAGRRGILAAALAACCLLGEPLAAQEGRAEELRAAVAAELAAGRFEEALDRALDLVRVLPDSAPAWEQAFRALEELIAAGRVEGQMEEVARIAGDLPSRPGAWVLLGKVYQAQASAIQGTQGFEGTFRQALLQQAEESFRRAVELGSEKALAGNHLAYVLFLQNRVREAGEELERVRAAHPEDVYAAVLLGEVELRQSRPARALALFDHALSLAGEDWAALSGRVRALVALERRSEAADAVVRLARADPWSPWLPGLAASIFEPIEKLNDAASLYRRLIEIVPESADLCVLAGRADLTACRTEAARAWFEKGVALDAVHEAAHYWAGVTAETLRDYGAAIERYVSVLEMGDSYLPAALQRIENLALWKAQGGDLDGAIALFDRLIVFLPFDASVTANRALALSQSGRTEEADRSYRDILEISPRDSAMLNDYALHLLGSGRTEEGCRMLEQAVAIDGNPDAAENLGCHCFFGLQDAARARPHFEKALESDPYREKSLVLLEATLRRSDPGDASGR